MRSASSCSSLRRCARLTSGLPVAVLQPTAVYGPYGGVWTEAVIRALRSGRQILVNGGDGLGNAVYVDDLVSAMLLAAVREGVVGEAFLVSGPGAVTFNNDLCLLKAP